VAVGEILLITLCVPVSATYTFPKVSNVMPLGLEKVALDPAASVSGSCNPVTLPANVVTVVGGMIERMLFPPKSLTKKTPEDGFATIDPARTSCASVPTPSEYPETPPTKVETSPLLEMRRKRFSQAT
jgi:hypothetical protein